MIFSEEKVNQCKFFVATEDDYLIYLKETNNYMNKNQNFNQKHLLSPLCILANFE
jgi:hypothetical protein